MLGTLRGDEQRGKGGDVVRLADTPERHLFGEVTHALAGLLRDLVQSRCIDQPGTDRVVGAAILPRAVTDHGSGFSHGSEPKGHVENSNRNPEIYHPTSHSLCKPLANLRTPPRVLSDVAPSHLY